ncbi:MAG: heme biosynthesis protein HemY [Hyphomicrobiales bacterium]|nr:heme biosynthesis protein HemY [Hyphomicrobiales bacterium]
MIRVLMFILLLALAAWGAFWLAAQQGGLALTWNHHQVTMTFGVAVAALVLAALALSLVFALVRWAFALPSVLAYANRIRRRNKGLAALMQGMVAAGAGDTQRARRAASDAARLLPDEPMALLLSAQAAQLAGDREGAAAAFGKMSQNPATKLLGLRGLHVEARRRGDDAAAVHYAQQARQLAVLPWSSEAVLEDQIRRGDWKGALATVDANASAKIIDKATARRHRAVLQTAAALAANQTDPESALRLAQDALANAPGLVPAAELAGRLLTRRGDIRRAVKILEKAWIENPHPEIAAAYLDVRPGDSTTDRMARAQTLALLKPRHAESHLTVARAALDARDFAAARRALDNLDHETPAGAPLNRRTCLTRAELEDRESNNIGGVREWLARAAGANPDPGWVADGVAQDHWAPASPLTGKLDAFQWQEVQAPRSTSAMISGNAWDPAHMLALPVSEPAPAMLNAAPLAMEPPPPAPEAAPAPKPAAPPAPAMAAAPDKIRVAAKNGVAVLPVVFPIKLAPDDPGADTPPADEADAEVPRRLAL